MSARLDQGSRVARRLRAAVALAAVGATGALSAVGATGALAADAADARLAPASQATPAPAVQTAPPPPDRPPLDDRGRALVLTLPTPPPSRPDERDTVSPRRWRFDFTAPPMRCAECPATDMRPERRSNAPWAVEADLAYASPDTAAAVGVVAHRNYQAPFYMSRPLANAQELPSGGASFFDPAKSATSWLLTARFDRTLFRARSGLTLGIVGDLFVPVGAQGAPPGAREAPRTSSWAGRLGTRVRF